MLSRFLASVHVARFLVTPAKPALLTVFPRSLMVSSRVASPKVAEPKTTSKTKQKKTKAESKPTNPKKGPGRPKTKETPKKIVITDDMKPPKRVTTPYIIFSQEHSSKLPKLTSVQEANVRARECGAAWKALSDSEKEPYFEEHRRRHEEYIQKKEEWFKNVDPRVLRALNKKRVATGKPRLVQTGNQAGRPLNPYARFMTEFQNKENLSFIEASRAVSVAWKSMPEEDKKQYMDRFKQEMEEWRQHNVAAGEQKA